MGTTAKCGVRWGGGRTGRETEPQHMKGQAPHLPKPTRSPCPIEEAYGPPVYIHMYIYPAVIEDTSQL